MDIKTLKNNILVWISKYRYALLILLLGAALMLLPNSGDLASDSQPETVASVESGLTTEQQLANILSKVRGAGEVEVILSYSSGEKTIYQTDTDISSDSDGTSSRSDTVTVTDADRNQTGLVSQVNPPVYQGAIIVCQGADDPAVKLAIVDAVSNFTGLGADKISVLKMK